MLNRVPLGEFGYREGLLGELGCPRSCVRPLTTDLSNLG